jgi:Leucine-rich repeat (LRR) protein
VQLRELILEGADGEDLDALAELPQLTTLALRRSTGSLAGLGHGFAALRSLDLSARANVAALGPDALSPIARLHALQRLSLHDGGWSDIAALAGLHDLVHLDLRSTDVASLAPLAGLTQLETLDLSGCTEVTNIDALAQLDKLTRLELAYTRVRRIQPLAHLRALEFVELSGTPVRDLSPLFALPALRKVGLEACEIDNLAPLRDRGVALIGVRAPEPTWRDLAEGLLQRSRQKD